MDLICSNVKIVPGVRIVLNSPAHGDDSISAGHRATSLLYVDYGAQRYMACIHSSDDVSLSVHTVNHKKVAEHL